MRNSSGITSLEITSNSYCKWKEDISNRSRFVFIVGIIFDYLMIRDCLLIYTCSELSGPLCSDSHSRAWELKYLIRSAIKSWPLRNLSKDWWSGRFPSTRGYRKLVCSTKRELDMRLNHVLVRKSNKWIKLRTKRFKRVNKLKKFYYSDIFQMKMRVTVSTKAFRCIKKMGSFDNYILCTKPKDLDSKLGEYLRTIMLRKINDP